MKTRCFRSRAVRVACHWAGRALAFTGWIPTASAVVMMPNDFTSLSLEELGAIKVTSVSKKAERLSGIPAAVTVLTADDFLKFGAASFPEAIRLAAGTDVGRVDALQWAVSVRGFNDAYAQKLLVLRDGRSVYTPLFSGTFWQIEDAMLQDIARIEVVKGPGGTVWGANAVNGVINIVSKPARETQGTLVTAESRTDRPVSAAVRHGGALGPNSHYRVYAKYDEGADADLVGGGSSGGWKRRQAGFRTDGSPRASDLFTLQGDYVENNGQLLVPQVTIPSFRAPRPAAGYNGARHFSADQSDGNVLGRWTRTFDHEAELSVQAYYTRTTLDVGEFFREDRDTLDLDFRHRFQLTGHQEVVWGGGARESRADARGTSPTTIGPGIFTDRITNLFFQDEFTLIPEILRWTWGTKIERSNHTGAAWEPGTRLAWTPTRHQTVWASLARAIRTPFLFERSGRIDVAVIDAAPPHNPFPALVSVQGSENFREETLLAHELGYRLQVSPRITLDLAAYYNRYRDLRTTDMQIDPTPAPNYLGVESVFSNRGRGRAYGGEFTATWQVSDGWRVQGTYTTQRSAFQAPVSLITGLSDPPNSAAADQQISVRTAIDLAPQWMLAVAGRYVGTVKSAGVGTSTIMGDGVRIPHYTVADVRLEWRPRFGRELSIGVHDLGAKHTEFGPTYISREQAEVAPSYFVQASWKL